MADETFTKICPNCGAEMPINFGFITWCDRCNYNLGIPPEPRRDLAAGLYPWLWGWLEKHWGPACFQAAQAGDLRPRLTVGLVLAGAAALLTHGLTLWLAADALTWLWLAVRDWGQTNPFLILIRLIGAVVVLLVVWKVRPRVGKVAEAAVPRAQAAAAGLGPLFALADRIADALHAPRVQAIQITPEFKGGLRQQGWRQDEVLLLGLPLVITLDPPELVGLLARQLAHQVSGDPQQVWLIRSAVDSLAQWADLFYFKTPALAGRGLGGFVILIFQSVMRVLRLVAQLGGGLMAVLIFPAAQRAEYRADGLAAQAAGTAALLTLTRKLYLPQAVQNIYHKARFDPTTHILQEIRERAGRVPDREWLRIDRVIALGETRLAPTHPTTQARLALLRARPAEAGQVTLSAAEWAAVMQGLRGYEHLVEHQIRQAVMEKS